MASLLVLIPKAPLVLLMVLSSVLNGILLPFVLVFALALVNNKKIMGDFVNSRWHNYVAWATIGVLIILTAALLIMTLFPNAA